MSKPLSKNGWTREELESQILWCKGHIARLELRVESAKSGLLAAQQELETLNASVPKVKCCERDTDGDGNCPVHSSPGVSRNRALNHLTPSGDELVHGEDSLVEAFQRNKKARK